ncbi:hypothetical protein BASA81_013319 [Batrachochytrium salamandrivorans]|nr:hypothetical protein BASA81_013319 [Batrachochytrium salamandrivorans]
MFSATATATATTTTPSLLKQFWTQCKGLLSIFSPCGSSALFEESTENQAKPAYSSPLASSIISEVTAAAIHNAPVDARATQLKNAKCSKEVTKVDSGVQVALPMETCNPFPKDICVDWFKCTNITHRCMHPAYPVHACASFRRHDSNRV